MVTANWTSLDSPTDWNTQTDLEVGKNVNGILEIFTVASDKALWYRRQGTVFTVGTHGALWHLWQVAPNGSWSNWASLGNPSTATVQSAPSVRKNKDGRLETFNICSDDALWHIWQGTPGGVWRSWDSLGTPSNSVILSAGPFVIENTDGRQRLL